MSNFRKINNKFCDYQYGNFGYQTSQKNKKFYFIYLNENLNLLRNIFIIKKKLKKTTFEYVIDQHYLNISDVIKIYFFTFNKLISVLQILNRKNFFYINKTDCKNILQSKFI